jgi:hypothetical protein
MSASRLIIAVSLCISILGIECAKETSVSGIEITNGNCVGRIYHANGSVADGAVVRLIPRDYNPFSHSDSLIDSAITDGNGRFSFNVKQLSRYNFIAQKAAVSCMDSIELIPDATITVIDTLRESGFISGAVRLQEPDTAQSIVVLVMGTNIFAMPSDTSGKFVTPLLAAGSYTLRIFSTQAGYGVFDTVVIVEKGVETRLPEIFLASANAPSVGNFSMTLDSLTMYATLGWSLSDTGSIVSYSLHRTSKKGNDSLITIDKSLTWTTDDVFPFEDDTLTYQIAGVGKNFREGFRSKQLTLVPRQKVRWDKRIATQWNPQWLPDWIFVDYKGNIFMGHYHILQKLDANGNLLNHYGNDEVAYSPQMFSGNQMPQADDFGNIYWKENCGALTRIIRFDADLNKRGELILNDSSAVNPYSQPMIAVTQDGKILVIRDSTGAPLVGQTRNDCPRLVAAYDSNFVKQGDYAFQGVSPIREVTRFGDRFAADQWVFPDDQHLSVGWYDQKFNALSAVDNFDYVNNFRLQQNSWIGASFGGPGGRIVTYCSVADSSYQYVYSVLYISTEDKKLVARLTLPGYFPMQRVYFDQAGNFYTMARENVDGNDIVVIYRYPMGAVAP